MPPDSFRKFAETCDMANYHVYPFVYGVSNLSMIQSNVIGLCDLLILGTSNFLPMYGRNG